MVVNAINISHELKNKGQLSIEKDIMKCEKIIARSFNRVSSGSSKNGTVLDQRSSFQL